MLQADPTDWVEWCLHRLIYDNETGKVYWKSSTTASRLGNEFTSKPTNTGYLHACICKKMRLMHRVVWVLVHGTEPEIYIDHIDGNKKNNRIDNLRDVPNSVNGHNHQGKGYYWYKATGKWHVQIMIKRKHLHIGYFLTEEEARAAYEAAKKLYGFIHR